ncbi:MAG TPA: hypothetical protein VJT73_00145 [Polyangiaceae bacterium]|nr:hypothetical protein [Polyangiaceae bacterium]
MTLGPPFPGPAVPPPLPTVASSKDEASAAAPSKDEPSAAASSHDELPAVTPRDEPLPVVSSHDEPLSVVASDDDTETVPALAEANSAPLRDDEAPNPTPASETKEDDMQTWVARPVSLPPASQPPATTSKLPPPLPPPARALGGLRRTVAPPSLEPVSFDDDYVPNSESNAPLPAFHFNGDEAVSVPVPALSVPVPALSVPVPALSANPPGPAPFGPAVSAGSAAPRARDRKWLVGGAACLLAVGAFVVRGMHAAPEGVATPDMNAAPAKLAIDPPVKPEATKGAMVESPLVACSVQMRARLLSKVVRDVPTEMRAYDGGDRLWIGVATEPTRAQGLVVERASLSKEVGSEVRSPRPIRRIVALGSSPDEFFASAESDERKIWPLSTVAPSAFGEGRVEAVRTARSPSSLAVTFRRQGAIYGGLLDATGAVIKPFDRLEGAPRAAPGAGAPSVGSNGRETAVVFADRSSNDEPWQLWLSRSGKDQPAGSRKFALPPGGPGGSAIAPSLAGLSDGRWLLAWTEGGEREHVVRGATLDRDFSPIGEAFDVSARDANAGQPALAIADGRGAVTYLVAKRSGFELWASSVSCQ